MRRHRGPRAIVDRRGAAGGVGHERREDGGSEAGREANTKELLLDVPGRVVRLQLGDDERVQRRPSLGPVTEDDKLERQRIGILFQELVDAVGVRREIRARLFPKKR